MEGNLDHPILIYCASEESSDKVSQSCLDAGFTNVKSGGSYNDLLDEGCDCPGISIVVVTPHCFYCFLF